MKLTLFRNKGAPHAIPNSLVPGSICFDRFSLRSRILFEPPLSDGSLPNVNPPSFCIPLAVRMTKVCYLGDYGQFLSARAAKQMEGPILPPMGRETGYQIPSWVRLLPHPLPKTHPVCVPVWPLGDHFSTLSPAKHCTASTCGEEERAYRGELLLLIQIRGAVGSCSESLLCGWRVNLIILVLNAYLSLILMSA